MKHPRSAVSTVLAIVCASTPLSAGGLFSDSAKLLGSIGNSPSRIITLPAAPNLQNLETQSFKEAVDESKSLLLNAPSAPTAAAPAPVTKSYDALVADKTPEQRSYEAEAAKNLGVEVSNICLTASHACTVSYTTTGSTCFCTTGGRVDLGIVK